MFHFWMKEVESPILLVVPFPGLAKLKLCAEGSRSSPSEHQTSHLEQDLLGPSESKAPLIPCFWNKPRGSSPGGGT